jgi:hypothetical protein
MQQATSQLHGLDLFGHLDSPSKLLYGLMIIIIIVYSPIIPTEYRIFADSFLGRVFGIGIVFTVTQTLGWVYGLLTALAFLLILNGAPRSDHISDYSEGFDGGGSVSEKKTVGRQWFVESVLKENTQAISQDRVVTTAVHS